MRLAAILILALALPGPAGAVSGTPHKCKAKNGSVYYTDKACSTKNERDKPVLDKKKHPKK